MSNPLTDEVVARSQLTDDFLFQVVDDPNGTPTARTVSYLGAIDAFFVATVAAPTGVAATDTAAIQAALDAARTAGGGIVQLRAGTYSVTLGAHPVTAGYGCALTIGSKTTLRGVGVGATVIKLAASQTRGNDVAGSNGVIMNYTLTGGDEDINIAALTVDGDAANQTHTHGGINFLRLNRGLHVGVKVKNCRGTAVSGANETFHFDASLSSNVRYESCIAEGSAGSTASGFSANSSTLITYTSCHAQGMTVANGFTHNGCSGVLTVGCTSVLNTLYGFNAEDALNTKYVSCIAGCAATSSANAAPWNTSQSLGNTADGFVASGATVEATFVDCTARSNGGSGLNNGSGSTVVIIGGNYSNNAAFGLGLQAASLVAVAPAATGNTTANISLPTGYIGSFYGAITAPAVAGSNADVANPFPFACMVYVTGGTVSAVSVNAGYPTGLTSGSFLVHAYSDIRLTYTVAPTWVWFKAPA